MSETVERRHNGLNWISITVYLLITLAGVFGWIYVTNLNRQDRTLETLTATVVEVKQTNALLKQQVEFQERRITTIEQKRTP